jgi:hypothetical protein
VRGTVTPPGVCAATDPPHCARARAQADPLLTFHVLSLRLNVTVPRLITLARHLELWGKARMVQTVRPPSLRRSGEMRRVQVVREEGRDLSS